MKKTLQALCWLVLSVWIAAPGMAETRASRSRTLTPARLSPATELYGPRRPFAMRRIPARMPLSNAADKGVTLYGINTVGGIGNLVSFPASALTSFTTLKSAAELDASGAAVYVDGRLYVYQLDILGGEINGARQYVWDAETWTLLDTRDGLWSSQCATDLAYDPSTGKVWGQFYTESMDDLWWGSIDPETNTTVKIARMGIKLFAIACTQQGDVYGISNSGKLVKVDKEAGTFTEVGNTTLMPRYLQSATIDPDTGIFYWAAYLEDGTSGLYTVDLSTGAATLVSAFPDNAELTGLFTIPAPAADDAPGAVTDLSLDFTDGALSGRVRFNLPRNTYGGDKITTLLDAYVEVEGDGYSKAYDDEDAGGASMSIRVTVPKAGIYTFRVYAQSPEGKGVVTRKSAWIGPDAPKAVSNLTLTKSGTTATLTWDAPAGSLHGGYFNPAEVTYRITRMPGNAVVAESHTSTTFTEEFPEGSLTSYTYTVIPVYKEAEGPAATSNAVSAGSAFTVPVSLNFNDEADRGLMTIDDGNDDGNTWIWHYGGGARYSGNTNEADDWLFSPAIHLEGGKQYDITYSLYVVNGLFYPENYEIKAGSEANAESMTTTLKEAEGLPYMRKYVNASCKIAPAEDGDYYIGFHTMASPYSQELTVKSMSVTEGASLTAPAPVTGLTASAADRGELKATLSMTAPDKDNAGNTLTALGHIDIYRGDVKIGTVDNPAPGSCQTYTDNNAAQGDNVYKAIAVNSDGEESEAAETTVYVGVDTPSSPENVRLTLEGNNAVLTWDAPAVGANGGYIDPSRLTYSVYASIYDGVIKEGIKDTRWSVDVTSMTNADQSMMFYGVYAVNEAGGSTGVASNSIVTGKSYELPFYEDFRYGMLRNEMWIQGDATGYAGWDLITNDGYSTPDGCSVFSTYREGSQRLTTGKITLAGAGRPVLRFATRGTDGDNGHLDVEVATDYNGTYKVVKTVDYAGMSGDWFTVEVPLDDYSSAEYIHISFNGVGLSDVFEAAVDDITVENIYDHNLAVTASAASATRVEIGQQPVGFTFTVDNKGANDVVAADWQLRVDLNGIEYTRLDGTALKAGAGTTIDFNFVATFDDPTEAAVTGTVVYDADEYAADDCGPSLTLKIDRPDWPAVDDLRGELTDGGAVALEWTKPDLSGTPEKTVTDGFEDYESFEIERVGNWTMHNIDGSYTYTINGFGWPHTYEDQAWIVWEPGAVENYIDREPLSEVWWPHTGDKCMACFAEDDGLNDDWLITPQLSGNAQTVSFFARSTIDEYGLERFEMYYSATDTDPASFVKIGDSYASAPSEWTEFTAELPAGARYFAIRCVSPDRFCLLVDDVTFEGAARPLAVDFLGFNVYRAGELMNPAGPVAEPAFNAAHVKGASYFVKVAYNLGESARSNEIRFDEEGIAGISADDSDTTIYDLLGRRVVNPVDGSIYIVGARKMIYRR